MRPGHRLVVIDLSTRGALVEGGRPLRPGSSVDLQVETDARRGSIAAKVVRCAVAAIDSQSGVTYRAALSFNDACDWVGEALTPAGYAVPGRDGAGLTASPVAGDGLPAARDEGLQADAKGTE